MDPDLISNVTGPLGSAVVLATIWLRGELGKLRADVATLQAHVTVRLPAIEARLQALELRRPPTILPIGAPE
jgi:hypothetical protein